MYFSTVTIILGLVASTLAAPTSHTTTNTKRALQSGMKYADFQISDGKAGDALNEALQKFPIDMNNLASVSDSDHEIIKNAREIAESAEADEGGFNDAIDQAGEDSSEGEALQVGKIKNKVLKLALESMDLMIKQAQGDDDGDVQEKLDKEMKKLKTNVQEDQDSKGKTSKAIDFDAGTA
ncbi:uncharacterized protein K452DRAFT_361480 [Aplosporella prunicola CBS 121167]|uniref:Small secreted protein n=1 Tax=Aplosporella prunicola CBS 121167 TaxID=1176127 RepID=A0A6A6B414_9PEZI|nr:uncharacterized protein K452DRAFT_361480 [Aplosporella prunicola CBS 121167]KAF2137995.1 hypothetical protein K452DRAFT_361480 [Aplosporella prunicola CBS 121167]